jgi:hypothetical protein
MKPAKPLKGRLPGKPPELGKAKPPPGAKPLATIRIFALPKKKGSGDKK